jgi:hypothetical protein
VIDVSLWSSGADLSAYYQRIVREATEAYIGDFPDNVAVSVRYKRVYHYDRDLGERSSLPSPKLEGDPFPGVPSTLRRPVKSLDTDSTSVTLQRSILD